MFYWITKYSLLPLARLMLGMHTVNMGYVPRKGAAILASNHVSFLDHFVLPGVVRRRITFVAKAEYFDRPVSSWIFTHWGQIPIQRGGGDSSALERAEDVLRDGGLFGIYPEGTRSTDGNIHRGKTGVARLALTTGAAVIPVGCVGTFVSMPKYQRIPRPHRVDIRFGRPLDYSIYRGMQENRELVRAVTDQIMMEIGALTRPVHRLDPAYRREIRKRGTPRYDRKHNGLIPGFEPGERQ